MLTLEELRSALERVSSKTHGAAELLGVLQVGGVFVLVLRETWGDGTMHVAHLNGNGTVLAHVRSSNSKGGYISAYGMDELRPAPPMSSEARMVWHAMRAGAKRVGRYEWADSSSATEPSMTT